VDLEPFLVEAWEGVGLAGACGGGLEVGGADEGVALVLDLVGEEAVTMFAAATAGREERGGEANGTGRDIAGGVGVAPGAGVLMGVDGFGEVAFGGMAPGDCLAALQLIQGGQVCLPAYPHPWEKLQWVGYQLLLWHATVEQGWEV